MVYWVFGYGSLIWKPPPHAVEQKSGYVKGVVRRFAQSSNDHRGTPEKPGRVVTVVDAAEWHRLAGQPAGLTASDIVWGVCYLIDAEKEDEVRAYLEFREKNGYTQHHVPVYSIDPVSGEELVIVQDCSVWIGALDNEAFVGYEELNVLAKRIFDCHGPSGPNREYVYKLAESVRALYPAVQDDYLFGLEAAVKALDPDYNPDLPQ